MSYAFAPHQCHGCGHQHPLCSVPWYCGGREAWGERGIRLHVPCSHTHTLLIAYDGMSYVSLTGCQWLLGTMYTLHAWLSRHRVHLQRYVLSTRRSPGFGGCRHLQVSSPLGVPNADNLEQLGFQISCPVALPR